MMISQERLDLFYKRKEFNNFHLFSGIRWCVGFCLGLGILFKIPLISLFLVKRLY